MSTRKALSICAIVAGCIFAFFVLYVFFMIGGSDYTTYPHEKASVWICEDPYFVFSEQEDYLEWEGKKYEARIMMKVSYFDVYLVTENFVISQENILFRGRWKYEGENMVVKITEDNFFDGAYKELVFVPQK